MWNRREFLSQGAGSLLGLAAATRLVETRAADVVNRDTLPDGSAAKGMITPEAQQAINNGLAFLARNQEPDHSFGSGLYRGNVAVTALAGLAFMSGGHQPGRGRYGDVVTAPVDCALKPE